MSYKPILFLTAIGIVGFLLFAYWYQPTSTLQQEEIEEYLSIIENQPATPGGRHDLVALREFLESDDGRPFYTVNLYKYFNNANYPEASEFNGSGEEAYERFADVMIKLMAYRGSHPIFASDWSHSSSDWDRIVIVRYRSRRDLVDVFASVQFEDAMIHKWASIERHNRMLVTGTHIPNAFFIVIPLVLIFGFSLLATRILKFMKSEKKV
jgi:uncharacterized protein (DUF1330 family)